MNGWDGSLWDSRGRSATVGASLKWFRRSPASSSLLVLSHWCKWQGPIRNPMYPWCFCLPPSAGSFIPQLVLMAAVVRGGASQRASVSIGPSLSSLLPLLFFSHRTIAINGSWWGKEPIKEIVCSYECIWEPKREQILHLIGWHSELLLCKQKMHLFAQERMFLRSILLLGVLWLSGITCEGTWRLSLEGEWGGGGIGIMGEVPPTPFNCCLPFLI